LAQKVSTEIILVDDGSRDGSEAIINNYVNQYPDRIFFVKNEKNSGVAASRNRGIALAKGKYIAFLDADDWWEAGKLSAQLAAINKSGAVICGTGRELMAADGTSLGKTIPVAERVTYTDLLKTNSLSCSSVVVLRSVMAEFPMEHDELHEDYYSWLRILKTYGPACGIAHPYLKSRMSAGGKSRNKLISARMHFGVYRLMGITGPKAWYYFLCYTVNGFKKYS